MTKNQCLWILIFTLSSLFIVPHIESVEPFPQHLKHHFAPLDKNERQALSPHVRNWIREGHTSESTSPPKIDITAAECSSTTSCSECTVKENCGWCDAGDITGCVVGGSTGPLASSSKCWTWKYRPERCRCNDHSVIGEVSCLHTIGRSDYIPDEPLDA